MNHQSFILVVALVAGHAGTVVADTAPPSVASRCGACHALPPANVLPQNKWREIIQKMYELAAGTVNAIAPSEFETIIHWYESSAPEKLEAALWKADFDRTSTQYRSTLVPSVTDHSQVSDVFFADILPAPGVELVVVDMGAASILAGPPMGPLEVLVRTRLPLRAQVVDLDRDGFADLLIAGIGWATPSDANLGTITAAFGSPDGKFQLRQLARRLGRVSDARAADFDGDGDLDVVSSVFGNRSGAIIMLENLGGRSFSSPITLDSRSGAVRVVPADLNSDGRIDIVTAFSQEHETIAAFLNQGKFIFETNELYRAPHPNWGMNGLTIADLDGDADLDVVFTNGDSMDDGVRFKPWHGVSWLEQRPGFRFEPHDIGKLYGAVSPLVADIDGDGDSDVVAGSWFLESPTLDESNDPPGAVLFEQVRPGYFVSHALLESGSTIPTLAALDNGGDVPEVLAFGYYRLAGIPGHSALVLTRNPNSGNSETDQSVESPDGTKAQ
ncbi:MAG: FG-GAP-like repeat-containing protein [Pseudomonadales bacterium]